MKYSLEMSFSVKYVLDLPEGNVDIEHDIMWGKKKKKDSLLTLCVMCS